ncbi:hypothetical protein B0T26DRAFT_671374 [Lasiosphaeria miniovina]|uniref:Uncharacterized protein n=1 Tax=Lasiosphaeria miniovina TaxID=1954250 RepID=A0AA40EF40_9PEZI|nr:uncharacterized protein B0T26DRAFT_671374 [Lasiosphaeria miniovina]KAK0735201.1 hypothetical protein B0T26DRAFT_671374 [Lasiosphaeria miniovina]
MAPRRYRKGTPPARQPQTAETNKPVSEVKTLEALGAELQHEVKTLGALGAELEQQIAEFHIEDEVDDNGKVKDDDQCDIDDTYDFIDFIKAKQENNGEFMSQLTKDSKRKLDYIEYEKRTRKKLKELEELEEQEQREQQEQEQQEASYN